MKLQINISVAEQRKGAPTESSDRCRPRFRSAPGLGFMADALGPATRLTVAVKAPATSHEVRLSKIEAWLHSVGRSPNEKAMKVRLRELLGSR